MFVTGFVFSAMNMYVAFGPRSLDYFRSLIPREIVQVERRVETKTIYDEEGNRIDCLYNTLTRNEGINTKSVTEVYCKNVEN